MGLHPLKLDDDEVQRLLTRIYSETGYRLDRRDPLIAQYVMQKIQLGDFSANQAEIFAKLAERLIPAINAEAKKFEELKAKLQNLARDTASDVVHRVGDDYTQHIREAMRKVDNTMLEILNKHAVSLRHELDNHLSEVRKEKTAFSEIAKKFQRFVVYFLAGGFSLAGIAIAIVAIAFWK